MKVFKAIKNRIKYLPPIRSIIGRKINTIIRKWKIILNVLVSLSTIFSLILVFVTLREMQIQRDRAYTPLIVIEDTQVNIEWNGCGSDDGSMPVGKNPLVKDANDVNPTMITVKASNIGVGVAKKIRVTINTEKLLYNMFDTLNKETQYNPIRYELNKDGDQFCYYDGTKNFIADIATYYEKNYLLPNAKEGFTIEISSVLTNIVKAFFIEGEGELLENYPITLKVSYQDIQGKDYTSEIKLILKEISLDYGSDGSGYATYQIKSK